MCKPCDVRPADLAQTRRTWVQEGVIAWCIRPADLHKQAVRRYEGEGW